MVALQITGINSGAATFGTVSPSGSVDSRAKAMAWIAANFPVGSTIEVLQWPGREGNFLRSPDQARNAWGPLGQLVVALVVPAALGLAVALAVCPRTALMALFGEALPGTMTQPAQQGLLSAA